MTSVQKVIKYLAIAFAVFLIISIISGILGALFALSGVLGLKKDNEASIDNMTTTDFKNNYIEILDIDVAYTNLVIKTGDSLKIETNNTNISCKQNNKKLYIEEGRKWFYNYNNEDLIVYIPENLKFEKVEIKAGAGKISIEKIDTKNLSFVLGAGETKIETLNVSDNCNIEGGAGRVDVLSGKINNLDLDMGVGEINLTTNIVGKSDIDAGIGELNINILGNKNDYKIKVDKGIGSIRVDGTEISNGATHGNGENYIDIDGGIGSINIDFE